MRKILPPLDLQLDFLRRRRDGAGSLTGIEALEGETVSDRVERCCLQFLLVSDCQSTDRNFVHDLEKLVETRQQ